MAALARIDPAAKLLAAFGFAVATSQIATPALAAVACIAPLGAVVLGGAGLKRATGRLIPVNLFFLFLWLTMPLGLSPRPDVFATLGPLYFNTEGLHLALGITLKGNAIALAIVALVDTSPVSANARALSRLGAPRKLVTLLLLTHANLFRMRCECTRIFQAARLRGFSPRLSRRTFATYGWLAGMLLLRSWQRSRRVGQAMALRGFQGIFPTCPTPPPDRRGRLAGAALVGSGLLLPALLLVYERWG